MAIRAASDCIYVFNLLSIAGSSNENQTRTRCRPTALHFRISYKQYNLLHVTVDVENYLLHPSDTLDFERTISYDTLHTISS
jgi:hypothetical protein